MKTRIKTRNPKTYLNQLQLALVEQFKDKRFLLVVDDVWNENYDDWEQLVRPFHSGAHGSKIIMTTRKDLLLKSLGFDHLDRLECLSQEDALSLFALHALGVDNFDLHPTLKAHGKGIVNKCGHLPLAIKAIGRLLRRKTNREDWDDELVLLWMAEGFLSPSNATKSPERSGHEYFEILLSRSFFQYAPNEESMFIMHDLMVDLATFVAEEYFLRVLSLSHFAIREVPDSIGSLKHLRYLNLSETRLKELPENVGNLFNLQTLIVIGCKDLTKLPKSFLKLKRLRHFDIRNTPLLGKLPFGISELESLQTLTKIIIGGGDDGLKINELKGLKNLHGEVSIEGLHKLQSATHAREATLSLKKITRLELQWVDVFDGSRMGSLEKEVLDELKPNSDTLKELSIMSYVGTQFSYWVGDPSFHKLVNVSIRGCRKCTSLAPFGLLHSLEYLSIQGMDAVEVIGMEVTGSGDVAFPSLKFLSFEDMMGLGEWSTKNEGLVAVFLK
ncbi:putative P-loop containing nucleoside triphosphate hydrolase, leucine-rich repeat domain superfamily [Helianthus annuus]|nr:putative P-loop containing nucleoside triphosphate hydrolase, leucine-rich repeat domain superfamily [Helianthus annuus]KAJ0954274.1 putative P-loop containing nucleoside triphosphate hydrolase, leucine-rich repeat domain superfamily [Helianthus annuus]